MPFEIVRNDITQMTVDAIVNTANPKPVVGSGTDTMVHKKAGPELLAARQKIGNIQVGSAEITAGYGLDARYVIHTVGPVWDGGCYGEEALLRNCYDNSLKLTRAFFQYCFSVCVNFVKTVHYQPRRIIILNRDKIPPQTLMGETAHQHNLWRHLALFILIFARSY